jgi:hypothetical protein
MKWKLGTEAAQFPEKEYINEIFVAVWLTTIFAYQKPLYIFEFAISD